MKTGLKRFMSLMLALVICISGILTSVPTETFAAQKNLTIHFKSPWQGANIFYWNVNGEYNNPVKWPGETMMAEGDDWYTYTVDANTSAQFLFTYEGKVTSDFVKKSGEWWYMEG